MFDSVGLMSELLVLAATNGRGRDLPRYRFFSRPAKRCHLVDDIMYCKSFMSKSIEEAIITYHGITFTFLVLHCAY